MKEAILNYIQDWEQRCYEDGIPDEIPCRLQQLNKAPSYKALVTAILKNDQSLKTIGFEPKKTKPYHELKRIEISKRPIPKNSWVQLKLF